MKLVYLFSLLGLLCLGKAQVNCTWLNDTVTVPFLKKNLEGDYLQTTLKNKSVVQLWKMEGGRFFLKMIVTENLYFGKSDLLEVKSGTKSFYAKDTYHYQYDKHAGYYMIEIYKNYAATLKDEGISSIVFGKAETEFGKQDRSQIKEISKCFYESIASKK